MNNNLKIFLVGLLVVLVAGLGAYLWGKSTQKYGATINYSNSGGSSNLYSVLQSMLADITAVRNPAASISTFSSSTFGFSSLAAVGVTSSTLTSSTAGTAVEGTAGEPVVGDMILVGVNSSTPIGKGVQFSGQVVSTGTIVITALQATSTTQTQWLGGNVPLNVIVFPAAGFKAPPSLQTSSSTSN